MNEIIIEKLLEQRDYYLNTLKHLDFQRVTEPSEEELLDIKKLQTRTINELKKVEKELGYLMSESK